MVGDTLISEFMGLSTIYGHEDLNSQLNHDCEDGDAFVFKHAIKTDCKPIDSEKDNKGSIFDESSGLISLPVLDDTQHENMQMTTCNDSKGIRKIKNRESAKKSRDNARKTLGDLQNRHDDLEQEVLSLAKRLKELEDENAKLVKKMKTWHSSFLDCDFEVMGPG